MTPTINSVSPERLAQLILQLRENIRLMESRLAKSAIPEESWDTAPALEDARLKLAMATELAARRAANTPVSEWVYLVHDWEINEPGQRGYSYARTPERAERLAKNGVKLTQVYTRHPASDFSASPALPSQVVGVSLADATTALERSLESEGSGINAYLRDDIEQAIAVMRSCLTSPAAEPVAYQQRVGRVAPDGSVTVWGQWRLTHQAAYLEFCRDGGDRSKYQYEVRPLYTHPAPSASREVTVTDEMVERAAQELLAHGEFSSIPWRNHDNALKAARAALLAALPEREG